MTECQCLKSMVVITKLMGRVIYRRRECVDCGRRWTTHEKETTINKTRGASAISATKP